MVVRMLRKKHALELVCCHDRFEKLQPGGAKTSGWVGFDPIESRFDCRTPFNRTGDVQTFRKRAHKLGVDCALAVSGFVIEVNNVNR